MNDDNNITVADDPEHEELTAYLDGELDADARAAVEARLARDEAYRLRMQRMDDAWALLDALPRTEVDADFTQTTVEMVALAAREEVDSAENSQRLLKAVRWGGWLAIVLLAGFVGYRLVDRATSSENDQLVRDLPVIENVELYRHIDDIQFLRRLESEGLFTEAVDAAAEEGAADDTPAEDPEVDDAT